LRFPPCFDAAEERSDAGDAMAQQAMCNSCAASLIRTGTIKNDVAIARYFVLPARNVIDAYLESAGNQVWIVIDFGGGSQIENQWIPARLLLLPQFVDSNTCNLQFMKEAAPLDVFVSDVGAQQRNDKRKSASPQAGECRNELLDLVTEEKADEQEASAVEQ
jgi:hypothetical protein